MEMVQEPYLHNGKLLFVVPKYCETKTSIMQFSFFNFLIEIYLI